jgi:hypothetical protein
VTPPDEFVAELVDAVGRGPGGATGADTEAAAARRYRERFVRTGDGERRRARIRAGLPATRQHVAASHVSAFLPFGASISIVERLQYKPLLFERRR